MRTVFDDIRESSLKKKNIKLDQNQKPNDKEKHPRLQGKISFLFLENCNVFMLEEVDM